MKPERIFYTASGALFLLMMAVGFHWFIAKGTGVAGRIIDPRILTLVTIHGLAIASWYVLFFIQSLLITVKKRKLHMTLGWAAVVIGLTIAYTGTMVAIRSVQTTPPQFHFFGMAYSRFLLPMLTEVILFTVFVTYGILTRKKPKIHRAMMMLASLTLLSGASARMDFLVPIVGDTGWLGLFAPVLFLGAVLLLIRSLMQRSLDKPFAIGYGILTILFIASTKLALTPAWDTLAATILKL